MPSPFDVDKPQLIRKVLDYEGVRYNDQRRGWQPIRCPSNFHAKGDRNPSASVNLGIGYFTCHGCSLKGDGFDLMMELHNAKAADLDDILGGVKAKEAESEWLF